MSTYVMSDLHGNYEKYIKALEIINFCDKDVLYILGDVIDRSTGSIKILMDMMMRINIIPLMGNHEYMAMTILPFLMTEINENNIKYLESNPILIENLSRWLREGGNITLQEFYELEDDQKKMVLEYLEEFRLYVELNVNNNDYVLVHAGLDNFSSERQLSTYQIYEMIFNRVDYSKKYFDTRYLVTGHISTVNINGWEKDKIYVKHNHIAIDCGVCYGGNLAILRLEDHCAFYV